MRPSKLLWAIPSATFHASRNLVFRRAPRVANALLRLGNVSGRGGAHEGPRAVDYFHGVVSDYEQIATHTGLVPDARSLFRGRRVLELGPGDTRSVALLARLRGARLVEGFDAFDITSRDERYLRGIYEAARYLRLVSQFTPERKRDLCGPALRAAASDRAERRFAEVLAESDGRYAMARLLDLDIATYLTDDINAKVDVAAMAHGLEVRCPFLDTAVVEFAARLPMNALMRARGKHVLRVAMEGLVPASVLWRPKRGFALPLERWMREDLRPMTRDLLQGPRARARGLFDPAAVDAMLARAERERTDADRLWTMLILEAWFREFVD